jgi:hypothetical protein
MDTGVEVYHEITGVSTPTLGEGLMRNGYGFRDVHFFPQQKGRANLLVVVFAFEWAAPQAENVQELQKLFAHYAASSWTVSIWDNPNLTATVNCTKRVRERSTKKVVAGARYLRIV